MAYEELEGGLGGAANGAAMGAQTGNPWAALGGAVVGGITGAIGGRQKKKARRKAEQRLREALQKLMAGSQDAYGNILSADNTGRWAYNLSNAGKNAKSIAERALLSAKNYQNKTPQQIADQNALMQALAEVNAKKATQSAVSQAGLRTGSNLSHALGNIARQSTQNLRNNILQGRANAANSTQYNINMQNALNNGAINAMKPLNSMQENLQNMVKGLNMPTAKMSLGIADGINQLNGVYDTQNAMSGYNADILSMLNGLNKGNNAQKIGSYQLYNVK